MNMERGLTYTDLLPTDWELQRRSFAYGNAAIENPRVTREMVDQEAETMTLSSNLVTQADCTPVEERYCAECEELLDPRISRTEDSPETEWVCVNAKCKRFGKV